MILSLQTHLKTISKIYFFTCSVVQGAFYKQYRHAGKTKKDTTSSAVASSPDTGTGFPDSASPVMQLTFPESERQ